MNRPHEEAAAAFCDAIRRLATNAEALDNLESYLSIHFEKWLETRAATPDGITDELLFFAGIDTIPF